MKAGMNISATEASVVVTILDANGVKVCVVTMTHEQAHEAGTALIRASECKPATTPKVPE